MSPHPHVPPRQGRDGFDDKIASARNAALVSCAISGAAFHFAKTPIPGLASSYPTAFTGLGVTALLSAAFQSLTYYLTKKGTEPPELDPHEYVNKHAVINKKPVVVMLGDSITHQRLSGKFCDMIAAARPDLMVVNAGQNSILTYTVLKERVKWVAQCKPAFVNIMIGTNDIKGVYKKDWGDGSKVTWNFPPGEDVSYAAFAKNLAGILDDLLENTEAKIALNTLPFMGEDLTSAANDCVREGNEIIKRVGKRCGERVTVVDVFGALERHLLATTDAAFRSKGLKVDDFGSAGPALAIRCVLLGQSYDAVCKGFGLQLMCDALHLNDTGAKIVAEKVLDWLRSYAE